MTGEHGLPLIGTGDWNNGMNRVGEARRRERVAGPVPARGAVRLRALGRCPPCRVMEDPCRGAARVILGLVAEGDWLVIYPRVPRARPGYAMTLRYRGAVYEIAVANPHGGGRGVTTVEVDGVHHAPVEGRARLRLAASGAAQAIVVTLGQAPAEGAPG